MKTAETIKLFCWSTKECCMTEVSCAWRLTFSDAASTKSGAVSMQDTRDKQAEAAS